MSSMAGGGGRGNAGGRLSCSLASGGGGGGGIGGVTLSLRRLCRSPCCGQERYASEAGDSGRPLGCLRKTLRSTSGT